MSSTSRTAYFTPFPAHTKTKTNYLRSSHLQLNLYYEPINLLMYAYCNVKCRSNVCYFTNYEPDYVSEDT